MCGVFIVRTAAPLAIATEEYRDFIEGEVVRMLRASEAGSLPLENVERRIWDLVPQASPSGYVNVRVVTRGRMAGAVDRVSPGTQRRPVSLFQYGGEPNVHLRLRLADCADYEERGRAATGACAGRRCAHDDRYFRLTGSTPSP